MSPSASIARFVRQLRRTGLPRRYLGPAADEQLAPGPGKLRPGPERRICRFRPSSKYGLRLQPESRVRARRGHVPGQSGLHQPLSARGVLRVLPRDARVADHRPSGPVAGADHLGHAGTSERQHQRSQAVDRRRAEYPHAPTHARRRSALARRRPPPRPLSGTATPPGRTAAGAPDSLQAARPGAPLPRRRAPAGWPAAPPGQAPGRPRPPPGS